LCLRVKNAKLYITADMSKYVYITWNGTSYHNVVSTKDIVRGDILEGNKSVSVKWKGKVYEATIVKLGKYS